MAARKSKKRTLRALSGALIKDLPTLEDWDQIIDELEGVSDRSAAILISAHAEDALSALIVSRFKVQCVADLEALYDRDGALSSFFSKIHLGYVMGLYDAETKGDLEVIRRVRNAFAHAPRPISFRTAEIIDECKKLKTINNHTHPVRKIFEWDYSRASPDNYRELFVVTGLNMQMLFNSTINETLRKELEVLKTIVSRLSLKRRSGSSPEG
jgi:hypothetical protein